MLYWSLATSLLHVIFYFTSVCAVVAKINEVDAGEEGDDNITFDDCEVDDDDIDEVRLLLLNFC